MTIPIEFLQSIPYFSGLSATELDSIREFIFEKKAERGEMVLVEGEPADILYFVASGAVKVDVPIFDGGPNPASAEAMGAVVLYSIRRSELDVLLRNHPQVALNVTKVLAGQARHLGLLVEDLSFRHVIGRVAKILIEYAGDGTGPRPRLTQQEIAAMAGTVREVVGRSLKALEEEGAIRLEHHRIVVANMDALKGMVEAYS